MANYTVRPGESWASIAGDQYGNQRWLQELANANGGLGRMLHPGDVIDLPDFNTNETPYVSPDWQQQAAAAWGPSGPPTWGPAPAPLPPDVARGQALVSALVNAPAPAPPGRGGNRRAFGYYLTSPAPSVPQPPAFSGPGYTAPQPANPGGQLQYDWPSYIRTESGVYDPSHYSGLAGLWNRLVDSDRYIDENYGAKQYLPVLNQLMRLQQLANFVAPEQMYPEYLGYYLAENGQWLPGTAPGAPAGPTFITDEELEALARGEYVGRR